MGHAPLRMKSAIIGASVTIANEANMRILRPAMGESERPFPWRRV
jgi:hypothetical protein